MLTPVYSTQYSNMLYRFVVQEMQGNRLCHTNICVFGIRIILGWLTLRKCRHGRSSKNQLEVILCKRAICKGTLHLQGYADTRKKGMTLLIFYLELNAKEDFNLHDSLALVLLCFSRKPPITDPANPNISFCFQLKMVPKAAASAILSYSVFLGLSLIYRRDTCY